MKIKIILICLFLSFESFAFEIMPQIVNGSLVDANDPIAKSTVMLTGKYQRFSFTCSGSIIAKDLIVTAAHCLGPYGIAKMTVFFGLNKKKPGITYEVKKQIMHENYVIDQSLDHNDIALILLKKDIPPGYEPIKLMSENDIINNSDIVTLAGYGINQVSSPKNGDGGIGILRAVEQNIIQANYGQTEILINIKNKGTCKGDSGGPALIKKNNELILVGAASRMTDKDIVPGSKPIRYECTEEIVYTSIYKHLNWIKSTEIEIRK